MTLEVLQAGLMVTVQDAGRFGLRHAGVSAAGPMDPFSFTICNALVGNDANAAALEFAAVGGRFRAGRAMRFAVAGGEPGVRVNGQAVAAWQANDLRAGDELAVGRLGLGVWGYLAVGGGIATEPVMGSRSTHLRTGIGGLDGRALRAGDELPVGACNSGAPRLALAGSPPVPERDPIRVVLGPQGDYFSAEALEVLTTGSFVVAPQGDRMAMALTGPELVSARGHDIISDGTIPGSIQVPGSRQPFVLMAESQTSGGYPKIATVIGADLHRLAQMPVGSTVRFALVGRDEAETILLAHRRRLRGMIETTVPAHGTVLTSEYLLSRDLVGGVWPAEEVVW